MALCKMSLSQEHKRYKDDLLSLKTPYRTEVRVWGNHQYVFHDDGEKVIGCIQDGKSHFREILINPKFPEPIQH